MRDSSEVHVDLIQLGRLAGRLDRAARILGEHADALSVQSVGLGLDEGPRRRLREAAAWAEDQYRALRDVVARVRRLEESGALPAGLTVSRRRHAAFADPTAAHGAALEAIAQLASATEADLRRAATIMAEHRGDPVFAATLLVGLGPDGVAGALHRAERRWSGTGQVDRSVVHGLADALAVAMRVGVSPFGWRALAARSDRLPSGSRAVGLLFTTPVVFASGPLVAAVRDLVVPLNRASQRRTAAGSSAWLVAGPDGHFDVRATVLRRVAADPAAARTVVATMALDDLAAAALGYADGGLAVADLLISGTAPVDPATLRMIHDPLVTGQRPAHGVSAMNIRKVIGWMGKPAPVPVGVEMTVDRLLRPWIGSIRSAGLDLEVDRHARLDEAASRRVLSAGMRFAGVRERLGEAAWWWAAQESRALASGPVSGPGFDAIGSVVGIVTIEAHDARALTAIREDTERHRQRSLWSAVQGYAMEPLPGAARAVAGALGGPIRDEVLPDTDRELEHWSEHRDRDIGHEALALEYLVMATLWQQRADNRYFAGTAPPPSLLVRRDGRPDLRPLVGLDAAEVADYLRWRSELAGGGPAPVQLAAERFLAEGRERPRG